MNFNAFFKRNCANSISLAYLNLLIDSIEKRIVTSAIKMVFLFLIGAYLLNWEYIWRTAHAKATPKNILAIVKALYAKFLNSNSCTEKRSTNFIDVLTRWGFVKFQLVLPSQMIGVRFANCLYTTVCKIECGFGRFYDQKCTIIFF
jgi:hypothetical protein